MKKRSPMVFGILVILGLTFLLAGTVILLTPALNRMKQEAEASSVVESFLQEYESVDLPKATASSAESEQNSGDHGHADPVYPELLAAMQEYNLQIYEDKQAGLVDPWCYTTAVIDLTDYGLEPDAAVGVLTIPKMNFAEPVYLGATMTHLDRGAAQLSISSMPIGGVNTNCVLAGHRGWNGALHFRHIELLDVGDEITLTNYWETLTYTVNEIKIIQPWQADELLIQEGRDLLTLLTCHPYGSGGKYRYVVYCERKEE